MTIQTSKVDEYTKISIDTERLDLASMKETKETVQPILDTNNKIILDLSAVQFLDSSGLSVLIGFLKYLNKQENGQLKLCALTAQPTELMEITQLFNVFDIIKDCDSL